MNRNAINKEITEKVFGEKWHNEGGPYEPIINPDYFTPEGFFKLWNKIQKMEWYGVFRHKQATLNDCALGNEAVRGFQRCEKLAHPDRLAPAVYDFIKGRK